jgi:hypothetical protein
MHRTVSLPNKHTVYPLDRLSDGPVRLGFESLGSFADAYQGRCVSHGR